MARPMLMRIGGDHALSPLPPLFPSSHTVAFWQLRNQRFLCSRLALGALGGAIGKHRRSFPLPFSFSFPLSPRGAERKRGAEERWLQQRARNGGRCEGRISVATLPSPFSSLPFFPSSFSLGRAKQTRGRTVTPPPLPFSPLYPEKCFCAESSSARRKSGPPNSLSPPLSFLSLRARNKLGSQDLTYSLCHLDAFFFFPFF